MSAVPDRLYRVTPAATTAEAYQALGAFGGTPGPARRGPLMANSIAEVGPLRILVVEPDSRTRSLLEVGLSRAGFDVLVARNLAEAQEHLEVGRALPGMLVCETDLEGEDGFRFCSQLRADLRTAHLPVVLLSQRPEAFHLEMASGAGADDYLPKPVFLNDVVSLARLKAGQSAAQAEFSADTDALPLGELLRALLAGMRSGRVELADGSAWLTFRQGQVVDVEMEGVRGARALTRMLLLARGAYAVTFGPSLARGSLAMDLRELCRTVLPDVLRSRRAQERSLPLEAVLKIRTARLREVLPDLPDGVNALIRQFDGQRALRQVILRCDFPEATTLLVATRLYGLGALEPVDMAPAESLEQALAQAVDEEEAAPGDQAAADPVEAFSRGRKLEEAEDRLEKALQNAASASSAAAAQAAQAPQPERPVDVVYFTPRDRTPPPFPALSPAGPALAQPGRQWWRSAQLSVVAGALALFTASVAVGSVIFRPPAHEPQASATPASRGFRVPDWFVPSAQGTADGWATLGMNRYDGGDLEGAKAAAAQSLELDPENGRALMLMATIHYGRGQKAEAEVALRRYLEVAPEGEYAEEARALLDQDEDPAR